MRFKLIFSALLTAVFVSFLSGCTVSVNPTYHVNLNSAYHASSGQPIAIVVEDERAQNPYALGHESSQEYAKDVPYTVTKPVVLSGKTVAQYLQSSLSTALKQAGCPVQANANKTLVIHILHSSLHKQISGVFSQKFTFTMQTQVILRNTASKTVIKRTAFNSIGSVTSDTFPHYSIALNHAIDQLANQILENHYAG